MKLLFVILLFVHALVHLRGFFIAIHYREQPAKPIPASMAVFWIIVSILFVAVASLFLLKSGNWALLLLFAVFISQMLIISQWKEALRGTIVNFVLVCVAVPAFANTRFQKKVDKEVAQLLQQEVVNHEKGPMETALSQLPSPVRKWLNVSGIMQLKPAHHAYIQQRGKMRLRPNGKWMTFEADEYITTATPSFLWNSSVTMFPFFYFNGKDKFQNGRGEMIIKGLSLVNVVNEPPGEKINESSLLRYLGEICWIPSAALQETITWDAIDSLHAKATIVCNKITASGIFQFNEAGDITGFSAERFYKRNEGYTKEKWQVNFKAYKIFNDVRTPSSCEIIWKLSDGDFKWMIMEITAIDYIFSPPIHIAYDNK